MVTEIRQEPSLDWSEPDERFKRASIIKTEEQKRKKTLSIIIGLGIFAFLAMFLVGTFFGSEVSQVQAVDALFTN